MWKFAQRFQLQSVLVAGLLVFADLLDRLGGNQGADLFSLGFTATANPANDLWNVEAFKMLLVGMLFSDRFNWLKPIPLQEKSFQRSSNHSASHPTSSNGKDSGTRKDSEPNPPTQRQTEAIAQPSLQDLFELTTDGFVSVDRTWSTLR